MEFYFRGHKSPLTLIQGDISGDFRGQSYDTTEKKANFRGHYVSRERKFRGHLKKSRAKSPFFEGQGKPCMNIQTRDNACMHQCGSLLMRIVVLLKLFNMLYAQLGPTMERIKYSILFICCLQVLSF